MAKQQKTYTQEFKFQAAQLVKSRGKPMSQKARDFEISDSVKSKWCNLLAQQGKQVFLDSGHSCHSI